MAMDGNDEAHAASSSGHHHTTASSVAIRKEISDGALMCETPSGSPCSPFASTLALPLQRSTSADVAHLSLRPPGALVLDRISSITEFEGCGRGGGCEASRKAKKHANIETQANLVKSIDALASRIDDLGSHFQDERQAVHNREVSFTRAFEALATSASFGNLDMRGCQREPKPDPSRALDDGRLHQSLERIEALLLHQHTWQQAETVCRQRVFEDKAIEIQTLREMTAAISALRHPVAEQSDPPPEQLTTPPRYRPYIGRDNRIYEVPEVEIGLKVYQICNVDTARMTYEIDFVCHLDWCDVNVEGIPDDALRTLDWTHYFNPRVEIDNGKDASSGWLEGGDEVPRRPGSAYRRSGRSGGGRGSSSSVLEGKDGIELGSRLRKTMRFRGALSLNSVNLRCFPFDVQVLPVKMKALRCRGLSLGTPMVDMCRKEQIHRVPLIDNGRMTSQPGYLGTHPHLRAKGHFAVPGADASLLEFNIRQLAGHHPEPQRRDMYEVSILVERPFRGSYSWDLLIMNLLVLLAASALWDTAAPELSSRMSISLTIILTLAAYCGSRPAPIEKAPYVTLHDWCEQMSMLLVTGISFQNVFAVVLCGGHHGEAPIHMKDMYEENQEICDVGWCFSRKVDCHAILILIVTWVCLSIYTVVWLARSRRATKGQWSRLLTLSSCTRNAESHNSSDSDDCAESARGLCSPWPKRMSSCRCSDFFARVCPYLCPSRRCCCDCKAPSEAEVESLADAVDFSQREVHSECLGDGSVAAHPVDAGQTEVFRMHSSDPESVARISSMSPVAESTPSSQRPRPRPRELSMSCCFGASRGPTPESPSAAESPHFRTKCSREAAIPNASPSSTSSMVICPSSPSSPVYAPASNISQRLPPGQNYAHF
eukprot:TRINITY_DN3931_c0_g1_i1.p1 TRINITY_DN3931_c0_g1~~TRINITY_DN3931_c0_g1_i1.p1  ORF type:complete len:884 (-),score=96.26 TRINITY_DN3931_c0_g1_i1:707-3358(-)